MRERKLPTRLWSSCEDGPSVAKAGLCSAERMARLNRLRKDSMLDAQPLKGSLILKNLRYR